MPLSSDARDSNAIRYQFGRLRYHTAEALAMDITEEEKDALEQIAEIVAELQDGRKLQGGNDADALAPKGKKAASKQRESDSE